MRRTVLLSALCLISAVWATQIAALDSSASMDAYLRSRTHPAKFSGSVLVVQSGKIVFESSYGMADYENSEPNSGRELFRIGSLTKPFTATAILQLQERSKLDVQDSIDRYIECVPAEWKKVTIHNLLSHGSGIPDLFGEMRAVPVEDTAAEIERVIQNVQNPSLRFEPGTRYEYSNFNYCLLGYILEKASGNTYPSYLKANIFDPAGMADSCYDDPRPIIPKRAQGYVVKEGRLWNDALKDPAGYAAGGLLSTPMDLLRFHRALNSGKLLSAESVSALFTAENGDYGYGWQITRQFNRPAIAHRGGTHGFSSYMVYFPEDDTMIVVLSNVEEQSTRAVACDIAATLFKVSSSPAAIIRQSGPEPPGAFAGSYRLTSGEERLITKESGFLYYHSGDSRYRLLPLSNGEFLLEAAEEIRFSFEQSQDGSIVMIRSMCGLEDARGTKVSSD